LEFILDGAKVEIAFRRSGFFIADAGVNPTDGDEPSKEESPGRNGDEEDDEGRAHSLSPRSRLMRPDRQQAQAQRNVAEKQMTTTATSDASNIVPLMPPSEDFPWPLLACARKPISQSWDQR
jgi:hypothetical protein